MPWSNPNILLYQSIIIEKSFDNVLIDDIIECFESLEDRLNHSFPITENELRKIFSYYNSFNYHIKKLLDDLIDGRKFSDLSENDIDRFIIELNRKQNHIKLIYNISYIIYILYNKKKYLILDGTSTNIKEKTNIDFEFKLIEF